MRGREGDGVVILECREFVGKEYKQCSERVFERARRMQTATGPFKSYLSVSAESDSTVLFTDSQVAS